MKGKFEPGIQCQVCGQVAPDGHIMNYIITYDENDKLHQRLTKNMPERIKKLLRHGKDKIGIWAHADGYGCQQ